MFFSSSRSALSLRECTAMFHAGAFNPTNHASQFGLVFHLVESLDVVSDRLGLAVVQASDALVVRRLTP